MTNVQRQWLSKLLQTMWIRIHDLWTTRNDDRHGRSSKDKFQASHKQAQHTIRALYLLRDKVLSEDQDIFYADLKNHLQQPLRELNSWVTAHQGLIAYSVHTANFAARANTKPITEHFLRIQPRQRKRFIRSAILPKPTAFRNMKLTSFVKVTRIPSHPRPRTIIEPLER
jgi:hypothetical protein